MIDNIDRSFCVAPMMGYTTPYARKLYRILSRNAFLFTEMIATKTMLYSKNKDLAIKLLEFLSERKAQTLYSEINFEFPVNPNVKPGEKLSSWKKFREDNVNISKIAEFSNEAQVIIDKVGW